MTQARKQGTIVIAANVDATEGPERELREAFIGQNFIPAGVAFAAEIGTRSGVPSDFIGQHLSDLTLVSPASDMITGQNIHVDGGW